MGTAYESYWKDLKRNIDKIDGYPVNGLLGRSESLAYKIDELEHHFHNQEHVYGNNTWMTEDYPVKWTVTGGDNDWGTEILIYKGDTIESSNPLAKMDINTLYVVSLSSANKISVLEMLTGTVGPAITSVTITDATDLFTKSGSGLVDGDKIIFNSVTTTTGLSAAIVYYVINVAGNNFQVSLTSGGAAVVVGGGNGSCSISKITNETLTKCFVSAAAVNADSTPLTMKCERTPCSNHISVRAKSESGETIGIGFLLGLHLYDA